MKDIKRILVAVKDPGARSQPAIVKAAQIAKACGARLELFHADCRSDYLRALRTPIPDLLRIETKNADARLHQMEALRAPLRKKGLDVTTRVERDASAYQAILHRLRAGRFNLIVAECHRKPHTAASLLRLTDWELIRLSSAPVLLVKRAKSYRHPALIAAVDPGRAYGRPGNLDPEILQYSTTLARLLRGSVHAAHAYLPMPAGVPPAEFLDREVANRLKADMYKLIRREFDQVLAATKIPAKRRHLIAGHPVDTLPRLSRSIHAAILVLGAVSRSRFKRALIGSTTRYLLDSVSCDLLIIKPVRS